ncbi:MULTISPECIES: restriction endonuclease subunit S [Pseudoalteromonas]|uniref:restriction endonuclease subunit S n=1 Tax=Pseudoalteromonas TaxID=53246 RepID=UPI00102378E9|nr:restriction endonuclease subunit S [Pseudoalteromonas sp. CO348]MCG7540783.1 restriction endonuclease subunit S [Pseudoalteromonas sp. OF7H-1]RZG01137.1 restriction endonuclease subunit S [Pseudoalteromonas sp. CO348]
MKTVKLATLCNVLSGFAFKSELFGEKGIPVVRIRDVVRGTSNTYYSGEFDEKYILENGDILVGMDGDFNTAYWRGGKALLNQRVCKIEVDPTKVCKKFIYYLLPLKLKKIWDDTPFVTVKHLSVKKLLDIDVPDWPLETQKQIAAVLEQADQLRKDCQQMEQELNSLAQSVFVDMFGDPVTNPKSFEVTKLKDLVSVLSGATPSKSNDSFWVGDVPWVSPKDMKVPELYDAIDHVNEITFTETNLKSIPLNSILIVVRGMILAHTVPLAITRKKLAINQDIKALMVKSESITSEFLLAALSSMHAHLLGIVSTAAHGTKRIDMADLLNIRIIVPSLEKQEEYIKAIQVIRELLANQKAEEALHESNFKALMQKAFKGELNL